MSPKHHTPRNQESDINIKKLINNDVMITPADTDNSIVILPIQQYKTKTQDFLDKKNFQTSTSNPTKIFQNQTRKTINHSTKLISQESKW
jgi:hypothetical protein